MQDVRLRVLGIKFRGNSVIQVPIDTVVDVVNTGRDSTKELQDVRDDVTEMPAFEEFPSISRLKRGCVITEKIDGTNAQIYVGEDGLVLAGSRNRWITAEADNYGFAQWVKQNEEEIRKLGPGRHYGEWWGLGIQRRYSVSDKRFSLFNASRWTPETLPKCCYVTPVLYDGEFSTKVVDDQLERLRTEGSVASPGFMNPEGVVIYLPASRHLYKVTLKGDGHKGLKAKEPQ